MASPSEALAWRCRAAAVQHAASASWGHGTRVPMRLVGLRVWSSSCGGPSLSQHSVRPCSLATCGGSQGVCSSCLRPDSTVALHARAYRACNQQ
jgi:hypothetical protein